MGTSGLGTLLVKDGLLSEQDRQTIMRMSGHGSGAFAKGVIATGLLTPDELASFLAEKTPYQVAAKNFVNNAATDALASLDTHLLVKLEAYPLQKEHDKLTVAMLDPLDPETVNCLSFFSGMKIKPVIAPLHLIHRALQKLVPKFEPENTELEAFISSHVSMAYRVYRLATAKVGAAGPTEIQSRPTTTTESKLTKVADPDISFEEEIASADPMPELAPIKGDDSALMDDDLSVVDEQEIIADAAELEDDLSATEVPAVIDGPEVEESEPTPEGEPDIGDIPSPEQTIDPGFGDDDLGINEGDLEDEALTDMPELESGEAELTETMESLNEDLSPEFEQVAKAAEEIETPVEEEQVPEEPMSDLGLGEDFESDLAPPDENPSEAPRAADIGEENLNEDETEEALRRDRAISAATSRLNEGLIKLSMSASKAGATKACAQALAAHLEQGSIFLLDGAALTPVLGWKLFGKDLLTESADFGSKVPADFAAWRTNHQSGQWNVLDPPQPAADYLTWLDAPNGTVATLLIARDGKSLYAVVKGEGFFFTHSGYFEISALLLQSLLEQIAPAPK
jgi:hypothetical protein